MMMGGTTGYKNSMK